MIHYQLQRHRRSQNIRIKIEANAQVVVVAPHDCPLHFINMFVEKNEDWITRNIAKIQQHSALRDTHPNEVMIFGQIYQKHITFSSSFPIGVHIQEKNMIINPVTNSDSSIQKLIDQFLKNTATKYIVPRTHQLANTMNIHFRDITLKNQKTRWGSCSSQGNLNFNWRLVHSPPEVIDYVIIHELAHRKEMNHSPKFWQIVAQFDPEHMKHRGWLKRHGMALG